MTARFAVIDLGGRAYDGIAAVQAAASAGATVLAVGQHDDVELRKAALAAGAARVLSYNKMFSDGPRRDRATHRGHAVNRPVIPAARYEDRLAAPRRCCPTRTHRRCSSASGRICSG